MGDGDAARAILAEVSAFCLRGRAKPWPIAVAARGEASPFATWPDGAHVHQGWEVKIALRGRVAQWLQDGTRSLSAPTVLLVPPGTVHGSTSPDDLSRDDALLCWTDDARGGGLWLGAGRRCDGAHHQAALRASSLRDQFGAPPAELAERIAVDLAAAEPYARVRAEARLVLLLSGLVEAFAPPPPPGRRLVERACAIMRRSYYDPDLGVAAIADELGCTARHLLERFRSAGRTGVRQELIAIRLQVARRLLSEGGRSVKEVARLTGWRSPFHFSRTFQRLHGHAPSRR